MNFDIREIPFSFKGSYMALSYLSADFRGQKNKEGLFLRSIHGDAQTRSVLRILPLVNNQEIAYQYTVTPEELKIETSVGSIDICFANVSTILVKTAAKELSIKFDEISDGSGYNYIHPITHADKNTLLINAFRVNNKYVFSAKQGTVDIQQNWDVERTAQCSLLIHSESGGINAVLQEARDEWIYSDLVYDYDSCKKKVKKEFENYYHSMPEMPAEYEQSKKIASYVNWTSIVGKSGLFQRSAMLMSKNWMTNVWSWDHCFNAMASAYNNHSEAFDQFMIMFDFQNETGRIPDSVNDYNVSWSFCKPPIHGWALEKMMQLIDFSEEELNQIYNKLSNWTNWWFNFRMTANGVFEYYHGNDSGWDNSTAFKELPPVQTPDATAFLVIQTEVLGDVALKLGKLFEAKEWKAKSDKLLNNMIDYCFEDGMPKAKLSRNDEIVECDSLILYLPIILGDKLPKIIKENILNILKSDKFYTNYGFATESPRSEEYISDGYWRGPIWAPSSMIIIDGLYQCGEIDFAKEATHKFCKMIEKGGCSENFDALTGDGLRDRAYTWTSSVFMLLANRLLHNI